MVQEARSRIPPENQPGYDALHAQEAYLDALKFWASPAAMHLREHMGMLPSA